jgi:DNA-binding XRE family transcriptional regulator
MRHGHWLKKGQGVGQAPRELTPLESALHFFGAQLRYWRTLRMLSQAELGRRTHDSGALISKIEKGERFPNLALAHRLDLTLDTGGALAQLWPQVDHERATRDVPGNAPARQSTDDVGDLGLVWSATPQATVEVVVEVDLGPTLGSLVGGVGSLGVHRTSVRVAAQPSGRGRPGLG